MSATVDESKSPDDKMPPNEADPPSPAAANIDPEAVPLTAETNESASGDISKAKFTNSGDNGDTVKVDIKTGSDGDYGPLNKAELMKYANDPFWIKLRWASFILFWICWLAMLVAAIVIIVLAPKCPAPAPKQWWQKGPIYEVYVKSFKDSDGDGVGDIQGVISKLDYLRDLNVRALWLSPVFTSPMKDNGYDISNYFDIDPTFGTMADFQELVTAMHDRGLKLIVDFVPNHSSDQHEWFQKSIRKEDPYKDFYIWADGKNRQPPNGWKNAAGASAWTLNTERGQYYLHQFDADQPDLNLRNEKVIDELTKVLRHWLAIGVDGFRVNSAGKFFEDENLVSGLGEDTFDAGEVVELLKRFRAVLDDKTAEDEYNPRMMMTEADLPVSKLARLYGQVDDQIGSVSHMPINVAMSTQFATEDEFSATKLNDAIKAYTSGLPDDAWSNYELGSHETSRPATRYGKDKVLGVMMVTMLLQGTPITYYGDEIGMVDGPAMAPHTTPMQWSAANPSAGFTEAAGGSQANPDYNAINVDALEADANSQLNIYRELAELRESKTILYGSTETYANGTVFVLSRVKKGNPGYLVVTNFGPDEVTVDAISSVGKLPERGILTLYAQPEDTAAQGEEKAKGTTIPLDKVAVGSFSSYLITFVPKI